MSHRKYFGIAFLILLVIWAFIFISAAINPLGSEKVDLEPVTNATISPLGLLFVVTIMAVGTFSIIELMHFGCES